MIIKVFGYILHRLDWANLGALADYIPAVPIFFFFFFAGKVPKME